MVAYPVLLVEDDLSLAQTIVAAIQAATLPIEHCSTGEVAIELLKAKRYSVLIVDLILPAGISGVYVVNALRHLPAAERPSVMMITGAGPENLRGVDRQLVSAVMFKPLDVPFFAQMVVTAYRNAVLRRGEADETAPRIARTFCGSCGSEIPPWVADNSIVANLVDPDSTFAAWLDTPCTTCGSSPRAGGGRSAWTATVHS